jgi:hypothetical protein
MAFKAVLLIGILEYWNNGIVGIKIPVSSFRA